MGRSQCCDSLLAGLYACPERDDRTREGEVGINAATQRLLPLPLLRLLNGSEEKSSTMTNNEQLLGSQMIGRRQASHECKSTSIRMANVSRSHRKRWRRKGGCNADCRWVKSSVPMMLGVPQLITEHLLTMLGRPDDLRFACSPPTSISNLPSYAYATA